MQTKLLYTLALISTSLLITAQNIPNGNFEQWDKRDHFKLDGWFSPTANVERTTDSKEGNYAIKLVNKYVEGANGSKGYVRTIDYNNKQDINGLAASADALSIAFWCKYDLAIGDTARLNTVLRDKGTYRGKVDFRFTGTSSGEYVKFSVPIEWGTSGSRQFDSAWFDLYSYVENKVDGDGYVIFDDIHFENISDRTGEFHNSGFEEWYNIGVDFPSKWRSIDLLVYDTYTSFLSTKSCVIADPESDNHGNSSITVQNYMSGANVRRGYAFIGEENNDYYTPHIPFMDTFKYLQGYYKYLPDGPDTARINFRTYATGRGTRSNNNLYLDEEKTEWTFFSLPLSYNATVNPDSAALIIYSANDDGQEYGINTRLFIDNLELVMEPEPLRLTVQEKTFSHSYYPNPTSGKVHIETNSILHTAQASNALGQLTNLAITNNTIDLAQLVDGLYFITIRTKQNEVQTIKIQKHSSY